MKGIRVLFGVTLVRMDQIERAFDQLRDFITDLDYATEGKNGAAEYVYAQAMDFCKRYAYGVENNYSLARQAIVNLKYAQRADIRELAQKLLRDM